MHFKMIIAFVEDSKTDAVLERQRMLNACGLVLERAYEKGWSYQRYARSRALERSATVD